MNDFRGRHLLSTLDFSVAEIRALVDLSLRIKRGEARPSLAGRILGLMFFNPSVRTRVSSEAAMARLGGAAIAISPGSETWSFEHEDGAVMDGATQEHVRELAPVLSRYCHAVGIRKSELITPSSTTARVTASWPELRRDAFLRAFAAHAKVPVINLESNAFHPCQGLADMATIVEKLGDPRGKKSVLTWAWHPKSLPVATPHSQLLASCDLGMEVTLLRPPGYELDPEVMDAARRRAEEAGGSLRETDDVEAAYRGARIVTAKSWGSLAYYGRFDEESRDKRALRPAWIVDEAKLARTSDAWFMHCLPVRRNVVVADSVLDGPRSIVVDEAENRLWTAAGVLCALLG